MDSASSNIAPVAPRDWMVATRILNEIETACYGLADDETRRAVWDGLRRAFEAGYRYAGPLVRD